MRFDGPERDSLGGLRVSGSWFDVLAPDGTRREPLREGLTRIGASDAEIRLAVATTDQLHVWNRPPRVLFVGRGAKPLCAGTPFEERGLRPGERIEWAGHVLVYGGEAADEDQVQLEELPEPLPAPTRPDERLTRRVRAGMACELGLVDARVAKRWREAVLAADFDPDRCAQELVPATLAQEAEQRMLERSATLLRDFLMAALLSGSAGARRKAREATRGLVAFLVTQAVALLVFVLIVAAALVLVRARGTSIDALLDHLVPG